MKIHEFYRDTAYLNLNGSIAALVPTIFIVVGNLSFFENNQIMLLTIPFLMYSFISFQLHLSKLKKAISIEKSMPNIRNLYESLFEARHLLVIFMNTQSPNLLLYYPNGHLAATIRKVRVKGFKPFKKPVIYALYNHKNEALGYYKVNRRNSLTIKVFNDSREYLGSYEKERTSLFRSKQGLIDAKGNFAGAVEGAAYFMDAQVLSASMCQVGRLRRGWMPLEWSNLFPEANTPVLTFSEELSEGDKLLRFAVLINEFFIER